MLKTYIYVFSDCKTRLICSLSMNLLYVWLLIHEGDNQIKSNCHILKKTCSLSIS